jgi:hypothetical protein
MRYAKLAGNIFRSGEKVSQRRTYVVPEAELVLLVATVDINPGH